MVWDWQQGGTTNNLTKLLYDLGQNTFDYDEVVGTDPATGADLLKGGKRFSDWRSLTAIYFEDATFLKLREVTLSVDLPRSFINSFWSGARYVRVGLSGRNLLKFTGYTGHDPEVSNFGNQNIARNIDVAPFPPSRSWWFSIDLGL